MEENNIAQPEVNVPPVAEVQNTQPLPSNKKLNLKLIIPVIVVILLVLVGALLVFVSSSSKNQNNNVTVTTTPTPEVTGQATVTDFKPKNPTLVNVLNSIKTKDNALIESIPNPGEVIEAFSPFVWYDSENFLLKPDNSQMIIELKDEKNIAPVANDIQSYLVSKGFSENNLNTSKLKLSYEKEVQISNKPDSNSKNYTGSGDTLISTVALENNDQKCTIVGYDIQIYNIKYPSSNEVYHMIQVDCSEGNYSSQKALFLENAFDGDGLNLVPIKLEAKDENFAIGEQNGFTSNQVILKKEGNKWITIFGSWGQQPLSCTVLTDKGLTESDITALGIKDTNGQCQ